MKILLFTDSDVFAGTERHILDLAIALRELQVDPLIAGPRPGALIERSVAAGLETHAVPKRRLIDLNAIRTIAGLIRRGRVELVHVHNGRCALLASLAIAFAGAGHCVLTQHFLAPSHVNRRGFGGMASHFVHRRINNRVNHFIAISEAVKSTILKRGDAGADRITVVHNGIVDPKATPLPTPDEIRQRIGVDRSAFLVVAASRLEKEKDIGTLVAAMKHVVINRPDAVCVIAGEGSRRGDITDQIDRMQLNGTVRLLGFRPDVLGLIQAADVFVMSSLAEPFGLTILESMALSKPVVATRAGGPMEIVEDGSTGLLALPGDAEQMSTVILHLLDHPAERTAMGEAGRRRYLECFTAARMASATLDVYRQVLGAGNSGVVG